VCVFGVCVWFGFSWLLWLFLAILVFVVSVVFEIQSF